MNVAVRSRICWCASAVIGLASAASQAAESVELLGTGFALERFEPAPAGDRYTLTPETRVRPTVLDAQARVQEFETRRRRFDLSVTYDLALNPLEVRAMNEESGSSLHYLHFGAAIEVLPKLLFESNLPLVLYQSGFLQLSDALYLPGTGAAGRSPDFGTAGDMRLGLRYELPSLGIFNWAISAHSWAPTGDRKTLSGDPFWRGAAAPLIAQLEGPLWHGFSGMVTPYVGPSLLHAKDRDSKLRFGVEGGAGLGLVYHFPRLDLAVTAEGACQQGPPTKINDDRWVEVGGFLRLETREAPWSFRAGALAGLTEAPGAAAVRFVAAVHFAPKQYVSAAPKKATVTGPPAAHPAPHGAGGFAFGATVNDAQRTCERAGLRWLPPVDGTHFTCTGAPKDIGLASEAKLDFCGDRLCAIRFTAPAEGDTSAAWLDHLEQLKIRLTRRFGSPTYFAGEEPRDCGGAGAGCWTGSRTLAWSWPSGARVTWIVNGERGAGRSVPWKLALSYESAEAPKTPLPRHDYQGL